MHSADFEIYSSASEKNTRDTLREFEQARSFFTQAMGVDVGQSASIRILVFGSKKEYEPYRPNEVAAAFYVPAPERDYIVLGGTGADVFPVAVHEYVHLVARHAGMNYPPWLNEGLAELYSTLKPYSGKILVGSLIPGRYQALLLDKWVPLTIILSADHNSPYYNEKDKAGSLYNEGWALTHMLALSPAYRPGYAKFLAAMRNGGDSADALGKVYGKTLSEIEKDLIRYLYSGSFQGALFPLKLERGSDGIPTEAASPMDVKLTLVDLINRPGREDEVEQKLRDLSSEDPQRPEPYVSLGYLSLRRQKREDAQNYFEKAFALGTQNTRMLWDYGRLIPWERRPEAISVIGRLLIEEPQRLDVRLFLAGLQLAEKHPQDAVQTLNFVKKVTAEDAPQLFKMLAYANFESGNKAEATNAARRWVETARNPSDRGDAVQFQKYLVNPGTASKPATELSTTTADSFPAALPPPTRRPDRPFATGSFVELKCDGSNATVVLKTTSGTRSFLIQDPTKILVDDRSDRTVDLTCGPQRGLLVRIEFEPTGTAEAALNGFVRAIHFTNEENAK